MRLGEFTIMAYSLATLALCAVLAILDRFSFFAWVNTKWMRSPTVALVKSFFRKGR